LQSEKTIAKNLSVVNKLTDKAKSGNNVADNQEYMDAFLT
jgi:hypothetical protein